MDAKPQGQAYIPFSAPWFGEEEKREVLDTLGSDWITTGPKAQQFERAFARYVGARYAVAVNSCTAALHLALAALQIGSGDAVVTSPFTFAATANVVVHQGAFPAFVDIDPDTYNLDPEKLEEFFAQQCAVEGGALLLKAGRKRVRAIVAVHYGGHPCDMDAINALATRYGIAVIEDAAHAVGARSAGRAAGTLGRAGCFSFYATKNMTTAEGGMFTTDDAELAERARVLSLHGISKDAWKRYAKDGTWQYDVVAAGYKYNMPDIAAAIGLQQLQKLDGFLERRAQLAARYGEWFAGNPGLKLPTVAPGVKPAWHLYPVQITASGTTRDEVINQLRRRNIGSSVHFIPLHLMTFYQRTCGYQRGDFPVTEAVFERIVSLPFFPRMTESDLDRVADAMLSLVAPQPLAIAS